jgi:pimeloyl-ACP methyl ester carboxylesterase
MPCVKTNGIEMHYEERGSGKPLILIMGLGADGPTWDDHAKAYERYFRCILVDNRGAGRSDKPEGPYSTRMMAEDIAGLMEALQIDKAHVSGISMGSGIAQELALMFPDRIRSLTLIASWDRCDTYTGRIFETFRSMRATADPVSFNRLLQLWIFTPEWHNTRLADLLQREEAGKSYPYPMPLHAFQAQCDACIAHDTRDRLDAIQAPVLVTSGNLDLFTPLHYSKAIASRIPGSELAIFEGGGHTHHWEKLEAFNEKTLEFLLKNNG